MTGESSKVTKTASLRWRLTLVSVAMLVLALVALDAAIYIGMRQRYYSDLRASVAAAVAHAREMPPLKVGGSNATRMVGLKSVANMLSSSDMIAAIYAPNRYPVVGRPADAKAMGLPRLAGPPATPDTSWALLAVAISENHSLIWKTGNYSDTSDTVLFVTSNKSAEAALQRLLVAELVGTVLVLALALFGAGVVIKLTLRPLDRMAAVAGSINAGNLSRRLRPSKAWTELGKLATALDAMLDSLSASIVSERHARERAASSEQRMRDFLSDASHELRTPIAALQWNAEALLLHGGDRKRREQLTFEIAKQAQRSSRLVDDLLQVARLDQGLSLEKCHFDLAKIAREELESLRAREPELDLRFSCEGDCTLEADPERIRQVIGNLIDNSRKAVAGKGAIALTLRRRLSLIELQLTDTGPGVPAADCERIFDRFVRLNGSGMEADSAPGSGLGLAIARGIAEAHGGRLVCVPNERGARFVLTLPLGRRPGRHAPVEEPAQSTVSSGSAH
jgi:two-component system OmpR family sensor kinase